MALTFFTSIPARSFSTTGAQRHRLHPRPGDDTRITFGAPLEIGNVGTAVVMFPILRRYSETLSLSYVASRTIEATIIGVGAISLLSIVTLRDDLASSIGRTVPHSTSRGKPWSRSTTGRSCSRRGSRRRQRHPARLADVPHRIDAAPTRDAGHIGGPLIFVSAIFVCSGCTSRTARTLSSRYPSSCSRRRCDLPDRKGRPRSSPVHQLRSRFGPAGARLPFARRRSG